MLYVAGPGDIFFGFLNRQLLPNGTILPVLFIGIGAVLYSFGDGLFTPDSLNNVILGWSELNGANLLFYFILFLFLFFFFFLY